MKSCTGLGKLVLKSFSESQINNSPDNENSFDAMLCEVIPDYVHSTLSTLISRFKSTGYQGNFDQFPF